MNIFLSIVIPSYNEQSRISRTLESIAAFSRTFKQTIEVIVVDDGSTDDTTSIVTKYQTILPSLQLIKLDQNMGKGFAVKTGMQSATGEYRLFMDADNSVDISNVYAFLEEISHGYDIVIGSISVKGSKHIENNAWYRRALGNIAKIPIRLLATKDIRDTQRGFKLFTAVASENVFKYQTIHRFGFDIELIVIAQLRKYKIKELPVDWDNPDGSKVMLRDYIKTFNELIKILSNKIVGKYSIKK